MKNTLTGNTSSSCYISIFYKFSNYISTGNYIASGFDTAFKDDIRTGIQCGAFYYTLYNDVASGFYAEIAGHKALNIDAAFIFYIPR